MKHIIDTKFYPGWTRKSITFSIDDGNRRMDKKFMDIVEPYGIKGTFNLCSDRHAKDDLDELRAFYHGYEIANHCKYHPCAFLDGDVYEFSDEPFNAETAEGGKVYPDREIDGIYYALKSNGRWYKTAKDEDYKKFVLDGHRELEAIFGKGSIRCFIWPCGLQRNAKLLDFVKNELPEGYYGAREGHSIGPEIAFALPSDLFRFGLTTRHLTLLDTAKAYEDLPDDGELKFFCFGVHSIDYERDNKWGDLEVFAKTYGARPESYYYASVGDIFDYADAVASLEIGDDEITNPSEIDVYVKIDGERRVIKAKRTVKVGK